MADATQMAATFDRLAAVFDPYRSSLKTKTDERGDLYLETWPSTSYPKGLFFSAVKIGKRYVSFHLMPVYVHPDLLDTISPALRKRMQGKSCFNFSEPDEALFAELTELTAAGFASFLGEGLIAQEDHDGA
ncbi:MAG: hypothetical protein M3Q50_06970 [Chloroflexota bacterium]|nr:hypothetical protein [Chloroflexota bacterium]